MDIVGRPSNAFKCLLPAINMDPIHTSCQCRAAAVPNQIQFYCIQAKNNRKYLVLHGSGSATARRMNWTYIEILLMAGEVNSSHRFQ